MPKCLYVDVIYLKESFSLTDVRTRLDFVCENHSPYFVRVGAGRAYRALVDEIDFHA